MAWGDPRSIPARNFGSGPVDQTTPEYGLRWCCPDSGEVVIRPNNLRTPLSGHSGGMVNQDHDAGAGTVAAVGWDLPDTAICSRRLHIGARCLAGFPPQPLRAGYLFGRELGRERLRADVDCDEEVVFLASVLHDLGITTYGGGDQRFEVDGADAAAPVSVSAKGSARTCRQSSRPSHRATHQCRSGPLPEPEHAICHSSIDMDISGAQKDLLPPGFADRVHAMATPQRGLRHHRSHRTRLLNQSDKSTALLVSRPRPPVGACQRHRHLLGCRRGGGWGDITSAGRSVG